MQSDFEHISEGTLASCEYLEAILKVIDTKAGVREDDEKRRAFKAVMSENVKKKDETLAQYAVRRQREFSRASDFGVNLPAELRAAMLREGALLTEQNMQNLTTLVGGNDYDPEAVCRALGRMDVRADRLIGYVAEENQSYLEMNPDDPSESDEEDEEVILAELDNMSLFEDQVHEVFAVLEARKRTWKENKIYKANLRKDRGSFTKTEAGSTAPRVAHGGPPGMAHRRDKKMKLNRDQLKKVTRCRRCHKKGHWAEDCTMPPPSNPASGPKMTGFVYSGSSSSGPTSAFTYATGVALGECSNLPGRSVAKQSVFEDDKPSAKQSVRVEVVQPASSFLSLTSGDAIVDIGATQDLIGKTAFEAMTHQLSMAGLQPIMVDVPVAVPLGIGGAAKVRGVALVPVSPGGVPGVLEFTILDSDVPPLLSVGFLEFLGAEISLVTNLIRFTEIDVELRMNRLSTGHRTISLIQWKPQERPFPVPDELRSKFGLKKGAFDLDCNAPSEYMKGCSGLTRSSSTLWLSSNNGREVASNQTSEISKKDEPNDLDGIAVGRVSSRELNHQHHSSSTSSSTRSSSVESSSVNNSPHDHQGEQLQPLDCANDPTNYGSELSAKCLMGASNSRTVPKFDQSLSQRHGFHQFDDDGKMAGTVVQGLPDSGDFPSHVPPTGSCRGKEVDQQDQVCGGNECGPGRMSAPHFTEDEAWQPIRQLDSLWGLWQSTFLHSQVGTDQEQGQAKTETISLHSSDHHSGGSGGAGHVGGDGTIVYYEDKPARTALVQGCIKQRPSTHRGDEDAVDLHAEHDVGHGTTECASVPDDGKLGHFSRSNGQQPIADVADDVQRELHGRKSNPGATSTTTSPDRRKDGGGHSLTLEHDGARESQCTRSNRPLRWPAKLVTAAAAWTALVPASQTTAPVKAFLANHEWTDDVWLIQEDAIPQMQHGEVYHQGRAPSISEVCHGARAVGNSAVCHEVRASSSHGVCPEVRASSNHGVCHEARASCNTDELLPEPWARESVFIKRDHPDGAGVPDGTIKTSAVFLNLVDLQAALRTLPRSRIVWVRLEDEEGLRLENRPFSSFLTLSEFDQPVKCSLWILTGKLHWLAGWADDLSSIIRLDESLSEGSPCWALKSTTLTELLQEEEGREMPAKGHLTDLKRCGKSLTALVQGQKENQNHVDFVELFSPPRVGLVAQKLGLRTNSQVFDLEAGWDVRKSDHRRTFRNFQKESRPRFLTASPECKAYSQLMNINWERMDPQKKAAIQREGALMWNFSLESAETQDDMGDFFALEHPAGAKSWKLERTQRLLKRPGVALIEFDMCALGLTVVPSGLLSRKRTKIATNHAGLAWLLSQCQCQGDHEHVPLENNLAGKARIYPAALCQLLAESARDAVLRLPAPSFLESPVQGPSLATGYPEDEEEEGHVPQGTSSTNEAEADPLEKDEDQPKVTGSQKRMVMKVHVNTGHPPLEQFLRMMRAGGAHSHVLKYIKEEFQCEQCAVKSRPDNRRRAHCPRSFAFNRVVSIDVLYIKFQQKSIPILNMVCTGSNYQIAQRLPVPEGHSGAAPAAEMTWRHFLQTWIRFFGPPAMAICDSGNEFKGRFERGCESQGILQHTILPECPWQNSKAERHGGWLKEKLDKEVNSGSCTLTSLLELDEFLTHLTAAKNRWFSRSGYTPAALVFGEAPRIPGDLLSDDFPGLCGHEDAHSDPYGVDDASAEFKRRHEIREKARQAAMEQSSREAISRAVKSATHQSRDWAPGQWVYVFRRGRPSQELHPRDRWVGPGVVVLSNNKTIYVAMRTRLWRCAPEQLRAALPSEVVLGKDIASSPGLAELLRQVNSGTYKGAVDITKERFPGGGDQVAPVERDEQGVGRLQDPITADRPIEAPQETIPIPPGLLPIDPSAVPLSTTTADVPGTRGRRRSMDSTQTVSEPEPGPSQAGTPRTSMLPPILEDEMTQVPSRPSKAPRLTSLDSVGANTSSSSSEARQNTRMPGSPVGPLLRNVSQEPVPPHMVLFPDEEYVPLTPGEELSEVPGRVAQQVEEFEEAEARERSPRRTAQPEPLNPTSSGVEENSLPTWFQEQGWSGTVENYYFNGTEDFVLSQGKWTLLAKRGDEISLKDLSNQEKELFDASDKAEWEAILNTKAVRIIAGAEAMQVRKSQSDRIISSRMVRRRKPQPGINAWKAKSRWCLHGHADPDTGTLVTYAPTPQAEGMSMFLQASLNLQMKIAFGDVKNAFCQSMPLHRPRGPLYAEPCQGLHLPPGALIAIDVPVYGLDDAPAAWRNTVASFLTEQLGFERNLVEPCWFTKFCKSQQAQAHILVEVDDFIVASSHSYYDKLKKSLTSRLAFGKWEEDKAEYAGRFVDCREDRILIDQSKYILEQVFPIDLPKSRRGQPDSELTKEEFEAFRSLVYKLNWVGRESRPEVAGTASIMASRLPQALIRDIATVNKVVNHLRCTANRPIIIWRFDPKKMVFVVCSDAGGINTKHHDLTDDQGLPTDATQGSWMVLTAEALPEGNKAVRATPVTWRSSKLKRKVFSTFGGETQAMLQGVNEVDWLQIMYRDAVFHDVELKEWRNSLSPHMVIMRSSIHQPHRQAQCSVTDAKSLYDCLLRGNPSGKQDRKSALELAIILKDLQDTRSMIRWVPHQKMLVDCMTKESIEKSNGAMTQFLKSGWLSLVDVQQELHNRKHDASFKDRSLKASTNRLLREYADQMQAFCSRHFGQLKLVGTDLMFQ